MQNIRYYTLLIATSVLIGTLASLTACSMSSDTRFSFATGFVFTMVTAVFGLINRRK